MVDEKIERVVMLSQKRVKLTGIGINSDLTDSHGSRHFSSHQRTDCAH